MIPRRQDQQDHVRERSPDGAAVRGQERVDEGCSRDVLRHRIFGSELSDGCGRDLKPEEEDVQEEQPEPEVGEREADEAACTDGHVRWASAAAGCEGARRDPEDQCDDREKE